MGASEDEGFSPGNTSFEWPHRAAVGVANETKNACGGEWLTQTRRLLGKAALGRD